MKTVTPRGAPEGALPQIHIGGTNAPQLLNDYSKAYEALLAACEAFEKIEFNSRDYLPNKFGSLRWEAAREWRERITENYLTIEDYLLNHLESLWEQ
jgi:hypothetical protein